MYHNLNLYYDSVRMCAKYIEEPNFGANSFHNITVITICAPDNPGDRILCNTARPPLEDTPIRRGATGGAQEDLQWQNGGWVQHACGVPQVVAEGDGVGGKGCKVWHGGPRGGVRYTTTVCCPEIII